jgi:hypothetical protein
MVTSLIDLVTETDHLPVVPLMGFPGIQQILLAKGKSL